jgi:DNA-binding MarR family transcriptional regulator
MLMTAPATSAMGSAHQMAESRPLRGKRYATGSMSISQICKELDMDKSTVAKMLMRLEKDGYITKHISPEDSRAFLVSLTLAATELTAAAREMHAAWLDAITCEFTEVEHSIFFELLHRVSQKSISVAESDWSHNTKPCETDI